MSRELTDTYRLHYPESTELYSWFDYRSRGFNDEPKRGMRIDHILCTPDLKSSALMRVSAMSCVQWKSLLITRRFGPHST